MRLVKPAPPVVVEPKRGRGRPPFKVTPEMRKTVEAMVAYGVPEEDIGRVIGCVPHTLRKYFAHEIGQAQAKANAKVAETLFQQAVAGNTTAMIFWLKCRAGWKEKQEVEHSGQIALGTAAGVERLQSELARIVARAEADIAAEEADAE